MQELGDKRDYLPIFEVDGFNLLLSDLIMQSYGRYGQVELCENGHIREFSNKTLWSEASQEGLKLYGSKSEFAAYTHRLKILFTDNAAAMQAISVSYSSPSDLAKFFQLAKEVLDEYVKMSPMFTDEAYGRSGQSPEVAHNLAHAEQAKEKYRQSISELLLESGSPLSCLVEAAAGKLCAGKSRLWWSTIGELTSGKPVNDPTERQLAFIQIGNDSSTTNHFGSEAVKLIRQFDSSNSAEQAVAGTVASRGKSAITRGRVKVVNIDYADMDFTRQKMKEMNNGDILVSQTTSPELMEACRKAAAVVTDVGGLLSHAAIVSREFGIACIIGTGNASKIFKDGDIVEINTDEGTVQVVE